MSEPTPLLQLCKVSKEYRNGEFSVRALTDIDLNVYPGEFVAIMGQSGSGKSTLMNIIGCLDQPSAGQYRVLDKDVSTLSPDELANLRRDVFGFVFQRYNLLSSVTASENVEIPAIYAGKDKSTRTEQAHQLLTKLGLGDRVKHYPNELSGGQQQRVAVARSLINEPLIILADEPTGALDSASGKEVMQLLTDLHREGRTIVLITHDDEVAQHAQRVVHIRDGRISSPSDMTNTFTPSTLTPKQYSHAGFSTQLLEATHMALSSLRHNIFRTALTLLGIIVGVVSVIAMLAVGSGSKQKVLDQINSMGTNLLIIRPGAVGFRGAGDIVSLVPSDADAIAALPNVSLVAAERSGRFTVRYGNVDYLTSVQANSADFFKARDWSLASGTTFTDRDAQSYSPVVVMGQTVIKTLFPDGANPLGKYIFIKNVPFEVIGTLTEKGASNFGGDQDDVVFIPLSTGLVRLFGKPYLHSITVKIADQDLADATQKNIETLLTERHRTVDFRVRSMAEIVKTATETSNTLTILLAAVAAISLFVGGIGVMNIMLVNVTERTREIGIRMATGARTSDILIQFNTEAIVVCTLGGLLGVLAGFAVVGILQALGVAVAYSIVPALLAFSCAFATGLVFGYLPARKAAMLDPVIALASE